VYGGLTVVENHHMMPNNDFESDISQNTNVCEAPLNKTYKLS
jgi:hypothetical protein